MKNIFFFSVCVLAIPVLGFAQEPAGKSALPASPTGKILVLENERTLEGDIEHIGEQYRIRRAIGETWLPGSQVLRLCNNAEEAYLFLRDRSNLNDPDERLKLAEWCHHHGLRPQALTEVQAAVQLRPSHITSKRLLAYLQQAATQQSAPAPPPPTAPEINAKLALNMELTGEAMGQFNTRVQPILMNSCASCHATGRGGSFKLNRVQQLGNRRFTQQNLAAVLATLNPQQPEASPFLTKALSLHGEMTQAPFRNRQTPAFRALEDWVRLTIANNPHAMDAVRGEAPRSPAPQTTSAQVPLSAPTRPPMGPVGDPAPATIFRPAVPVEQESVGARPMVSVVPATKPAPPAPSPDDPWDGEHFNQGNTAPQSAPSPQAADNRPGK